MGGFLIVAITSTDFSFTFHERVKSVPMLQPQTQEVKRIQAAQNGDMDAFEELVNEYQTLVFTTALQMLGDPQEADDIAQEAWLRAFKSIRRFRFRSKFSTWLYRIVVNQSLTALKRRGKRPGARKQDIALDNPDYEYPLASNEPGPRRILQGRQAQEHFQKALAKLPTQQRLAVTLVLLQDLSHREAGEIMRVAEKTVSWHLFKAREKLMIELKEHL